MKNKILITIMVVLALAASVIWYLVATPDQQQVETAQLGTPSATKQEPAVNNSTYASLEGDALDEAYIADMLAHHEAALNMAEQAQAVTAHNEIRTLAGNIIQTQSQEMMNMRTWQVEWGYEVTTSGGHMSHGGGGADMAGDMVEMQNKLRDLTGEAYDKEFLIQMIIHHEQAVEMSRYVATKALHPELKDLASAVISAQTAEINQMKQWQKDWGY